MGVFAVARLGDEVSIHHCLHILEDSNFIQKRHQPSYKTTNSDPNELLAFLATTEFDASRIC
jgi:hypothetical protein